MLHCLLNQVYPEVTASTAVYFKVAVSVRVTFRGSTCKLINRRENSEEPSESTSCLCCCKEWS